MINNVDKDGNVYDIGKVYWFYDEGDVDKSISILENINPDRKCNYIYESTQSYYDRIEEISPEDLGTIQAPKVELLEGECYSFTYQGTTHSTTHKGYYKNGCILTVHTIFHPGDCTNIKLLT